MVIAAALEAAALQLEVDNEHNGDAPAKLGRFVVVKDAGQDLINVSEAAARLRVSRTTVYDWINKGVLLGWKATRRGHLIPAEQIAGPGRVVTGVSEVLEIIEDPELAWAFLSQEWPFVDEVARPIDKLKAGEVGEVLDAAPGFGTSFS